MSIFSKFIHKPRKYQKKLFLDMIGIYKKNEAARILCVCPTGSGKTFILTMMAASKLFKNILVVVHRKEIVEQIKKTLIENSVLNATVMTIQSAFKIYDNDYDFIIVDEAHRCLARTYVKLINNYPDVPVLGLTATPIREDNLAMGNIFDVVLEGLSIPDLQKMGYLVKAVEYTIPLDIDLSKIKLTQKGEYNNRELSSKMRNVNLYGQMMKMFKEQCSDRKTIVYCVNVKHANEIAEEFRKEGFNAKSVSGYTKQQERDNIYRAFREEDVQIVTNCMLYTEGVDVPEISCIVLLRPTKSKGLYFQKVGRGLRACKAIKKRDCIVLDHAGIVRKFGSVNEKVIWNYKVKGREFTSRDLSENFDETCGGRGKGEELEFNINFFNGIDLVPYKEQSNSDLFIAILNDIKKYPEENPRIVCKNHNISFEAFYNRLSRYPKFLQMYKNIIILRKKSEDKLILTILAEMKKKLHINFDDICKNHNMIFGNFRNHVMKNQKFATMYKNVKSLRKKYLYIENEKIVKRFLCDYEKNIPTDDILQKIGLTRENFRMRLKKSSEKNIERYEFIKNSKRIDYATEYDTDFKTIIDYITEHRCSVNDAAIATNISRSRMSYAVQKDQSKKKQLKELLKNNAYRYEESIELTSVLDKFESYPYGFNIRNVFEEMGIEFVALGSIVKRYSHIHKRYKKIKSNKKAIHIKLVSKAINKFTLSTLPFDEICDNILSYKHINNYRAALYEINQNDDLKVKYEEAKQLREARV